MPKKNRAENFRRLPNRIREWRKAAGLSLEELAWRVGSTNPTLSRYERGDRSVTIELLEQLAPHLGCKPADLLPDPESVLDDRERRLLATFKGLSEVDRSIAERTIEALAETGPRRAATEAARPRLTRRYN